MSAAWPGPDGSRLPRQTGSTGSLPRADPQIRFSGAPPARPCAGQSRRQGRAALPAPGRAHPCRGAGRCGKGGQTASRGRPGWDSPQGPAYCTCCAAAPASLAPAWRLPFPNSYRRFHYSIICPYRQILSEENLHDMTAFPPSSFRQADVQRRDFARSIDFKRRLDYDGTNKNRSKAPPMPSAAPFSWRALKPGLEMERSF